MSRSASPQSTNPAEISRRLLAARLAQVRAVDTLTPDVEPLSVDEDPDQMRARSGTAAAVYGDSWR
jgi:hypothetical protein